MQALREVHLIHHSHTDFGFTDLPSTAWDFHVEHLRQAIQCAEDTKDYPEEARFRWVCESLWIVERFLANAMLRERRQFGRLVASGQIEVTAMPCNTTGLVTKNEW